MRFWQKVFGPFITVYLIVAMTISWPVLLGIIAVAGGIGWAIGHFIG